ncbi:LysR family transcriptional regulator [Algihabitans albus]|uniref:LysR family transcriptional regulator n=1 Tax=Algihabitans albus TaxID=2164067 RepID=UPI000E5D7725|nr:LysR family transcriptional regulator [Algihabitans albus]
MDLQSLRCFSVLAETLHFRRAAERLNMTQPALSLRLKRLEDELGLRLFERSRSAVALSEAGQEFLPHAEQLLCQASIARETAAQIATGQAGHLRIGYTPVSFFGYVPDLIRSYAVKLSRVRMSLTELLSDEVEAALAAREIDVGFLHPPVRRSDLRIHDLRSESFLVALSSENPLARKPSLTLQDLAGEDFVLPGRKVGPALYDRIISLCRASGFVPRIRQEVTTSIAVLGLVAAGHGTGLVISPMSCVARPGLTFRPLTGPAPSLAFAVATRSSGTSALTDSLVAHATLFAPPEPGGAKSVAARS